MAEDGEPGKDEHPAGGYTVGMFNEVSSVDEFAAVLGVPKKAIELVVPMDIMCRVQIKGMSVQCNRRQL